MSFTVDAAHLGPSEESWMRRLALAEVKPLEQLHVRRLVVVAPHPDDEVLGAGGLIQKALEERVLVEVVAVTNGEASHPRSPIAAQLNLADLRASETDEALRRLGWSQPVVTRLNLPDGRVAEHRRALDQALEHIVMPDDLCVAPWRHDGHPDHDACGASSVAASRAVGAKSLGYLIWCWHWAEPDGSDIPWDRCRRLGLTRRYRARKRWSTAAFRSQVGPIGEGTSDGAVLPEPVLRRFWRPWEIYVDESVDAR